MKRLIKFRGKRTDTGEWIYGYYLEFSLCDGEGRCSYIKIDGCQPIKVLPDTVGQFTGLLDKNRKDIYEGDVLQDTTRKARYKVYWSKGIHAWSVELLDYGSKAPLCCLDNNFEVIGTIHDNSKLLKGWKE